jgi:fibronectin-binding autotransporter adhesin
MIVKHNRKILCYAFFMPVATICMSLFFGSSVLADVTTIGSILDSGTDYYVGYVADGTIRLDLGSTLSKLNSYLGYNSHCTGTATVTDMGSTWTSGIYNIGYYGSGVMNIEAGGQVSSGSVYLGYQSGSTGIAAITGTGSNLSNNIRGAINIGYYGSGTLNVEDGGQVSSATVYLGYQSGSSGTAAVTGTGAYWSNGGLGALLNIGYYGSGTLNIEAGGQMNSIGVYLGYQAGSTGTALITGTGSTWSDGDLNALLNIGYYGSGTLNIEDGGQLSSGTVYLGYQAGSTGTALITGTGSTWSDGGLHALLNIGYYGNGTLNVEAGGQMSSMYVYLGCQSGSIGTALITGTGSTWTNDSTLNVGEYGNGTLNIQAGGQVSNNNAFLGYNSGSTGAATVTGTNSMWTNSGNLYVGNSGSGTLTVENGGSVTAQTLYASSSDLFGNGTITVKGAVLDSDLVFDGTHGLSQILAFGTGGRLNLNVNANSTLGTGHKGVGTLRIADGVTVTSSTGIIGNSSGSAGAAKVTGTGTKWTNSHELYVGYEGGGTLNILAGGQVSNNYGYIGYLSGSTGAAKVTGTNSMWTNSGKLYVGNSGSGTLTVENGGSVTAQTLYASPSDLFGNGTITVKGAVLDSDLIFDGMHGLSQSIDFGTGGLLNIHVDGYGALGAGHKGTGTLRIEGGISVASLEGVIGNQSGSNGIATITGTGSKWTNSSSFYVGDSGSGTLNIQAGGQISNKSDGYLGYGSGSTGTVTVTGTGSKWTNDNSLYIGYHGNGTLKIEAGGQVNSFYADISKDSGSSGIAILTGMGSTWSNTESLIMGSPNSILNVVGGAKVATGALLAYSKSTIILNVSGNDMLVLGNSTRAGTILNNGKINFYADLFLPAGTYTPISEYTGRAITWSGAGKYNGYGGTWNNTAKTFTVASPTALTAGDSDTITTAERLLFTDPTSGRHAGASFGAVTGSPTFSAYLMSPGDLATLASTPGFTGTLLTAWNYSTNLSDGTEVMLSYDLGLGYQEPQVWHLSGSTWSLYTPDLATYDSQGNFSFTVTSFSGYAVSAVPEPCTFTMLGISVIGLLAYTWRRHKRIL